MVTLMEGVVQSTSERERSDFNASVCYITGAASKQLLPYRSSRMGRPANILNIGCELNIVLRRCYVTSRLAYHLHS